MEVNKMVKIKVISIHAPREGGDICLLGLNSNSRISIHAPREGGDPGLIVT